MAADAPLAILAERDQRRPSGRSVGMVEERPMSLKDFTTNELKDFVKQLESGAKTKKQKEIFVVGFLVCC